MLFAKAKEKYIEANEAVPGNEKVLNKIAKCEKQLQKIDAERAFMQKVEGTAFLHNTKTGQSTPR